MLELYTDVTELLRHFYAILRRTGSQAVSCNAAAAAKAEGIVQRLVEDKGGRLEAKKRRIVAEAADRSGSRTDGIGSRIYKDAEISQLSFWCRSSSSTMLLSIRNEFMVEIVMT